MSKENNFIKEALSDIDNAKDLQDSTLEIILNEELIQAAIDLQKALSLSKDIFFNVLASYGAYCCNKKDFDESEFPKHINGTKISFNISTESETALNAHEKYNKALITVFGLIKMSKKLL